MDIYYHELSPPCRAVMLTAKALNVPLDLKIVDLLAEEQLKPEFLALNPEHTIPTMVLDNDFVLWESTAIQRFLVNKYGKDDFLYSRDPRTRALVDRMLHFSSATLTPRVGSYVEPIFFGTFTPGPEYLDSIHEALGYLNKYLEGHEFAVGNSMTIADHSLVTIISEVIAIDINIEKFANVTSWYRKCKETIPDFKVLNEEPAEKWGAMFKPKLQSAFTGKI